MHIGFLIVKKYTQKYYNEIQIYLNQNKHLHSFINRRFGTAQPLKINTYVLVVKKATQFGISKKIQPQKVEPYKIIDTPTLATYKLEDFSGKQITRHRSNIVPYYPKELFVHEQMDKYFSDNSLLKLHPKKPTITKSKTVSFSLDNPDTPLTDDPLPSPPCNLSEILENTSENYNTRNTLLRRQPIKDYRVFISTIQNFGFTNTKSINIHETVQ